MSETEITFESVKKDLRLVGSGQRVSVECPRCNGRLQVSAGSVFIQVATCEHYADRVGSHLVLKAEEKRVWVMTPEEIAQGAWSGRFFKVRRTDLTRSKRAKKEARA